MPFTITSKAPETKEKEPIPCEFCGKMREPIPSFRKDGSRLMINGVPMYFGFEECDCERAVAKRQARANEREREEKEEKERKIRAAILKADIPPRYRSAKHPWAEKMATEAALGQGFYITGSNGVGKTTLAMATAITLIGKGHSAYAIATYDLMDAMRTHRTEDRALFDRAVNCEVLILDDLGKEASNTPYACERLFSIIDKRDKALKPTIFTSNYKLSEVAEKITEGDIGLAIASRIAGSCKQVPMNGEDRRLSNG